MEKKQIFFKKLVDSILRLAYVIIMGDKRDANLIVMPMTSPSVEYHNVPNRVSLKNVKIRHNNIKQKILSKGAILYFFFFKNAQTGIVNFDNR